MLPLGVAPLDATTVGLQNRSDLNVSPAPSPSSRYLSFIQLRRDGRARTDALAQYFLDQRQDVGRELSGALLGGFGPDRGSRFDPKKAPSRALSSLESKGRRHCRAAATGLQI